MRLRIVAVDFDNVIHSYKSGWQGARVINDPPVPGAIEFLLALVGTVPNRIAASAPPPKFDVRIFSSRNHQWGGIAAMKQYLIKHGVDRGYFDDKLITFPFFKPPAHLFIDDRAMKFTGAFPSLEEVAGFRTWDKECGIDIICVYKVVNGHLHKLYTFDMGQTPLACQVAQDYSTKDHLKDVDICVGLAYFDLGNDRPVKILKHLGKYRNGVLQ